MQFFGNYSPPPKDGNPIANGDALIRQIQDISHDLNLIEAYLFELTDKSCMRSSDASDYLLIVDFKPDFACNIINLTQRLNINAAPRLLKIINKDEIDDVLTEHYCEIFRRKSSDADRQKYFKSIEISQSFQPISDASFHQRRYYSHK